jgi:hypothetical protein
MPEMLRDGSGGGYLAEVDSDNHLHTVAHTKTHLSMSSNKKQKAYTIYGQRDFAAADTDEGILYFQYTGTEGFHIDSIVCCRFHI